MARVNKYFLVSGVISILLGVAHTWWGITNAFPELTQLPALARASFEVSWYQVGATLFVGGIALLLHSFGRFLPGSVPTVVLAVYSVNFIVGLLVLGAQYPHLLAQTVSQLVLFSVLLVLLALGHRVRGDHTPNTSLVPTPETTRHVS